MGYTSTVIFSMFGFVSFVLGLFLIQCAGRTLMISLVQQSKKQDNFSKLTEKLPTDIYSLTDIGNMRMRKSELILESIILRTAMTNAVNYIDNDPDTLHSKILQYNFVMALLKYFRTFNRQLDKLLDSFPTPPDVPGEFDN
jgi:hypothetical protein